MSFLNEIPLLFAKLMSLYLAAELKTKILPLSYFLKDIFESKCRHQDCPQHFAGCN